MVRMRSVDAGFAQSEHRLRRRRQREQPPRGLVDADIGGLRRQQHGREQFEHAAVLEFAVAAAGWPPQRGEEGLDVASGVIAVLLARGNPARAGALQGGLDDRALALASAAGSVSLLCAARSASLACGLGGQALVVLALLARQALAGAARSARAPRRPAPALQACQPVRSAVTVTSAMQSTGQAGMHSSQPVHSASITVCMQLGRADDAVDRAGLDAQRAADAPGLVDHRQRARALGAAVAGSAAAAGGR